MRWQRNMSVFPACTLGNGVITMDFTRTAASPLSGEHKHQLQMPRIASLAKLTRT